jgi:hypothetical protein
MSLPWLIKRIRKQAQTSRLVVKPEFEDEARVPAPCRDATIPTTSDHAASCLWRQSQQALVIPDEPDRPSGRCGFVTAIETVPNRWPIDQKEPDITSRQVVANTSETEVRSFEAVRTSPAETSSQGISTLREASAQEQCNEVQEPSGNEEFSLWGNRIQGNTCAEARRISINRQAI